MRTTTIQPLQAAEIEPYVEHLSRHMAESGQGGDLIFSPYSATHPWDGQTRKPVILGRLAKRLDQTEWERAWAVWDGDRVVGHLDLKHRGPATNLHRACLGLGIEASHRRQGLGRKLIQTAIEWAREQSQLAWIDLGVFANNRQAHELYLAMGFVETGRTRDAFRVDGHMLEDVQMVYELRKR